MTEAKRNWLRLNRGYAWETAETAVCNLNWQDEDSQGTYTRRDNAARIYDSVCYRDAVENITSSLYF